MYCHCLTKKIELNHFSWMVCIISYGSNLHPLLLRTKFCVYTAIASCHILFLWPICVVFVPKLGLMFTNVSRFFFHLRFIAGEVQMKRMRNVHYQNNKHIHLISKSKICWNLQIILKSINHGKFKVEKIKKFKS